MEMKKEIALKLSLINYIQRCVKEDDQPLLNDMGLSEAEIEIFSKMSFTDTSQICEARSGILPFKVAVDSDVLRRMFNHIRAEEKKGQILDQLIGHDAPYGLMHALSGMRHHEYVLIRTKHGLLKIDPEKAKPAGASYEVQEAVWNALKETMEENDLFGAAEFMELYHKLQQRVPLRIVWRLFCQWEKDGSLVINKKKRSQ